MKILKKFKGHSGYGVFLVEENGKPFVYKLVGEHAAESASILDSLPFPTPEIVKVDDSSILMEYLPGIDMKQYLTYASNQDLKLLISFLSNYIEYSLNNSSLYNFELEITKKHSDLKEYVDIDNCISNIPKVLPRGLIHGDLTLENIIFYNKQFYFIDAQYTTLNSIYFDANKIRQDINGLWFLREEQHKMNYVLSCNEIYKQLNNQFPQLFDNNIYAFMLARILPYCKRDLERNLILSEIKKCKL
jgi:hypothetical protein